MSQRFLWTAILQNQLSSIWFLSLSRSTRADNVQKPAERAQSGKPVQQEPTKEMDRSQQLLFVVSVSVLLFIGQVISEDALFGYKEDPEDNPYRLNANVSSCGVFFLRLRIALPKDWTWAWKSQSFVLPWIYLHSKLLVILESLVNCYTHDLMLVQGKTPFCNWTNCPRVRTWDRKNTKRERWRISFRRKVEDSCARARFKNKVNADSVKSRRFRSLIRSNDDDE